MPSDLAKIIDPPSNPNLKSIPSIPQLRFVICLLVVCELCSLLRPFAAQCVRARAILCARARLSLGICAEAENKKEGQYKLPLEYMCNMMR